MTRSLFTLRAVRACAPRSGTFGGGNTRQCGALRSFRFSIQVAPLKPGKSRLFGRVFFFFFFHSALSGNIAVAAGVACERNCMCYPNRHQFEAVSNCVLRSTVLSLGPPGLVSEASGSCQHPLLKLETDYFGGASIRQLSCLLGRLGSSYSRSYTSTV